MRYDVIKIKAGAKAKKEEEIKMKFEHDCAHENGKRFVLMQEAYIDGPADSRGYYVADAFCPDDEADEDGFIPVYEVFWDILDDYDTECGDEGGACDWGTVADYRVCNSMHEECKEDYKDYIGGAPPFPQCLHH